MTTRVVANLEEDLARRLRYRATDEGKTLTAIVSEALTGYLARSSQPRGQVPAVNEPTAPVPDQPAPTKAILVEPVVTALPLPEPAFARFRPAPKPGAAKKR